MKRTLLALLGIVLILVGGVACKGGSKEKAKQQADSVQQARRRADSLAVVQADSLAMAAQEAERLQAQQAELEAQQRAANLKFHVIIGGFVIQSNADGYLARMQASYPEAKIFTAPNGFKLVSIGDFASFNEALGMIRGIWAGEQDSEERTALWVYEEGGKYDTSDWIENRGEDSYDPYQDGGTSSGAPVDEFDAK